MFTIAKKFIFNKNFFLFSGCFSGGKPGRSGGRGRPGNSESGGEISRARPQGHGERIAENDGRMGIL